MSLPLVSPAARAAVRLCSWFLVALLLAVLTAPAADAGQRKKGEAKKQASSRSSAKPTPRATKSIKATNAATKAKVSRREPSVRQAASARRGRVQATISAKAGRHALGARPVAHTIRSSRPRVLVEVERPAPRPSFGELAGLHATPDELELKSSVALVVDQDTHEVLLRKNDSAVLPIASLTKLMTALVVSEAKLPLSEQITVVQDDVDTEKHSRSRLKVGTSLSRGELLHLALMASENRAAHALGRTFPGGLVRFVRLMNARAVMLGMKDTRYVEPTGLSSANQSSATDLAMLVAAAYRNALVRKLSTSPGYEVEIGNRLVQFNNTNRLVNNPDWDIGVQKTGYIAEAGQCLVMQVKVSGRKLIMVFLDSAGRLSRLGDAERVRHWIETRGPAVAPAFKRTNALRAVSG